ncbi:hypothetical protein [Flavobacterium reichenbachii]|uniref:DUF1877 domain-containing protein n=1 Tax=Flavobacterium reichenbachii TaxID=362418 RepID=A0A085ZFZ3_9FLAO|nr:hypothetical protein [Flavobacterium reichenbachii]KFF03357.1 hypothetical protein IW19_20940 [Flavobacterium reichenbachii]OXB16723.1 hypothetical protein B0A68_06230 [Flavobacterium reichenbachii]
MALTGSLYKLSNEELKNQIKNKFSELESLKETADLSYYAIDLLEILNKFSGLGSETVGKIIQGDNSFSPEDGYIGYSSSEEVKINKETILDKITIEKFVEFWETGEQQNFAHTQSQNKTFVLKYFENIKEAYETAVNENMALIFRIG